MEIETAPVSCVSAAFFWMGVKPRRGRCASNGRDAAGGGGAGRRRGAKEVGGGGGGRRFFTTACRVVRHANATADRIHCPLGEIHSTADRMNASGDRINRSEEHT